jgi:hypothetical protein
MDALLIAALVAFLSLIGSWIVLPAGGTVEAALPEPPLAAEQSPA